MELKYTGFSNIFLGFGTGTVWHGFGSAGLADFG